MVQFIPNTSCGPCLYCRGTSEGRPQELVSCDLCRRPLHMTCLRNGSPQTTLLGDNFFQVTCTACSSNDKDSVRRANMSTVQILLLLLYNLHLKQEQSSKSGFFHWKIHILHLLNEHWKEIESPNSYRKRKKMVQTALSGQLAHYTRYFQSGQTMLGEGGWYRLVQVVPPAVALLNPGAEQGEKKLPSDVPLAVESTKQDPSSPSSPPLPTTTGMGIKSEPRNVDEWDYSGPSQPTWFTEKDFLMTHSKPPEALFEGEDGDGRQGDHQGVTHSQGRLTNLKEEITVKEENLEEELTVDEIEEDDGDKEVEEEEGGEEAKYMKEMRPSFIPPPSSFPPLPLHLGTQSTNHTTRNVRWLSHYEEKSLLRHLERLSSSHPLPPHLHRLRRKLVVRSQKMEHGLPLFSLDKEVDHWRLFGRIKTKRERLEGSGRMDCSLPSSTRILDRFQVAGQRHDLTQEHNMSFAARLGSSGGGDGPPALIHSPYTLRCLKPYIRRDYDCTPLKLQLLREIVSRHHQGEAGWQPDSSPPIDYCYVAARHIPAMNQLARHFFWPGIDLSEVLQYPDHTCVVLYCHLVVGFGIVVPDTGYNEAYLSFVLVHPEWRRAGIATFLLYHLIQTCPGKDVTLHVSATNPALILYQRFGFKVEEFLSNFYDKYLPHDSPECKHAMYMRLRR